MDSSATIKATVFYNQFNLIGQVCEGNLYLISGCTVQDNKFRTENTPSQHPFELKFKSNTQVKFQKKKFG